MIVCIAYVCFTNKFKDCSRFYIERCMLVTCHAISSANTEANTEKQRMFYELFIIEPLMVDKMYCFYKKTITNKKYNMMFIYTENLL